MNLYRLTSDTQVNELRELAKLVKADLETRILGQRRKGWSCCCGAIRCGAATANEVRPGGRTYPEQIVSFIMWTVNMKEDTGG